MPTAAEIIARLELKPHPEGGHYRETFRDQRTDANERSCATAIYFLLARGERSHWHRIDAVEVWHYYAGAPLILQIAHEGCTRHKVRLGPDVAGGERPQAIGAEGGGRGRGGRRGGGGARAAARPRGGGPLLGCTVAPGFEFANFELAPKGWE